MIFLDTTTRSLEFLLGGTVTTNQLPFTSHYTDLNSSFAVSDVESNNGTSNNITAVTLVAAPGASTFRQVKFLSIYNADTVNATVTLRYNDNATTRIIKKVTLEPDWTFEFSDLLGIKVTDESGNIQESTAGIIPLASGGTAAALTAVNGGIAYSTATALALSAAGSSGQILRSGGAGAPTWSTATYSSTASTNGAYLRADGTNWITSTLGLPNAATLTRVVYATGANSYGESANLTFDGNNLTINTTAAQRLTLSGSGTGHAYGRVTNTTGDFIFGVEDSVGSAVVTNAPAYAACFSSNAARSLVLGTNAAAREIIDSSGNFRWLAYGAGTLTTDASGNITAVSDERDKVILGPFTAGLQALVGLRPIRHCWKPLVGAGTQNVRDTENVYAGFSAQNVMQFIPEAVGQNVEGKYSLNVIPIVAATVTAMQELTTEIDELRAAVNLPIKSRGMMPIVDGSRIIVSPTPSVKA